MNRQTRRNFLKRAVNVLNLLSLLMGSFVTVAEAHVGGGPRQNTTAHHLELTVRHR
jgi:hypothetical protein